jgi:murein lipoprotein
MRTRTIGGCAGVAGLSFSMLTGCASTGDLDALATRVSALETQQQAFAGRADQMEDAHASLGARIDEVSAKADDAVARATAAEQAAANAAQRADDAARRADAMFKKSVSK